MCAAGTPIGFDWPLGVGVTTTNRSTPATRAGMAFISSDDG